MDIHGGTNGIAPSAINPIADRVAEAREARHAWSARPIRERLAVVRRLRHLIAEAAEALARAVQQSRRGPTAEALAAEVLPLADACRFLERRAAQVLRTRRLGASGRPAWLAGVRSEVRREPIGIVLIIGPFNYPLFLPGVQATQALAAGNAVVLKPGAGGYPAASAFAGLCERAGLPRGLLHVLAESAEPAEAAIAAGVDKVVLTGSARTGARVLGSLAPGLIPATMELSGCDAAFVRSGADLGLVARALRFGLAWNGGATCIAPRRVFVARELAPELERRLVAAIEELPPRPDAPPLDPGAGALVADAIARGARLVIGSPAGEPGPTPTVVADARAGMRLLREDIFAPVLALVPVRDDDEAIRLAAECPYALGATVFGGERAAREFAGRINAGSVVINDAIVPTADPRLPFGGRGRSGFGLTRGAEGLLEMTVAKVVSVRSGPRYHLDEPSFTNGPLISHYIQAAHAAGWRRRGTAWISLVSALVEAARRLGPRGGTMIGSDRAGRVSVVGGGLGGLAAACTLAARGHEVTLFDKNGWLGGKAAGLESGGYRFDMGPTILTLPSVLARIFAEAGRDVRRELDLIPLDPQWRCFYTDGPVLDLESDVEAMARKLGQFAPGAGSGEGYRRFLAWSERLHEVSRKFFFDRPVGGLRDMFDPSTSFRPSMLVDLLQLRMGRTVAGEIRSYLSDHRVAQMLDHFTQYVGSAPDRSPAVLCGIAHMQTSEGIWYPRGGTRAVPLALARLATDLGVDLRPGTDVARIRLDDQGRARGVETADGEFVAADAVVSNMDAVRTHRELVGGRPARRFERRRKYEPACSGVVLYLGLDRKYDHLLHHNFVFSASPEAEFDHIYRRGRPAPDPTCYVCAPAVTEPEVAPPGGEALYVLVHTPYIRPGQDWRAMLPGYRRVILDKLRRTAGLDDIESRIRFESALTPQDIHDRYRVLDGAIYGLASHGRFLGAFKPSNRSRDVPGLYLAGGAAHPGPGMPMVLMSGWIAADALDRDRAEGGRGAERSTRREGQPTHA